PPPCSPRPASRRPRTTSPDGSADAWSNPAGGLQGGTDDLQAGAGEALLDGFRAGRHAHDLAVVRLRPGLLVRRDDPVLESRFLVADADVRLERVVAHLVRDLLDLVV